VGWGLAAQVFPGLGLGKAVAQDGNGQANMSTAPAIGALDQRPAPICWAGDEELESKHGLPGVREALRKALARGDWDAVRYLGERMVELIGSDTAAALQVLEWAAAAGEPEFLVYLRVLPATQAVHDPKVVEGLLSMAETHADPRHQGHALAALDTQRSLSPQTMDRLTALARSDQLDMGISVLAARTLGRVMENSYKNAGGFEPYMERLLDLAQDSRDEATRLISVEMGTYTDAPFGEGPVKKLGEVLHKDPSANAREMAALVLSSGEDTEAVLEQFRTAFPAEKDLCVRWAIVRFSVRAGGARALPLLAGFAKLDPRFQQDYLDYKQLYASGMVDFNRISLEKKVHHSCEAQHEQ
jgi:hypothetical protein